MLWSTNARTGRFFSIDFIKNLLAEMGCVIPVGTTSMRSMKAQPLDEIIEKKFRRTVNFLCRDKIMLIAMKRIINLENSLESVITYMESLFDEKDNIRYRFIYFLVTESRVCEGIVRFPSTEIYAFCC
jgi:hypothetical protein